MEETAMCHKSQKLQVRIAEQDAMKSAPDILQATNTPMANKWCV